MAAMCSQTMYTDPTKDRMAFAMEEHEDSILDALDLPTEFQMASEEQTRAYYTSLDIATLNSTDIFGEGSRKEQEKLLVLEKRQAQRLKRFNRTMGIKSPEDVPLEHLIEEGQLVTMQGMSASNPENYTLPQQHLKISGVSDDEAGESGRSTCSTFIHSCKNSRKLPF